MVIDEDDENERPTLPAPYPAGSGLRFETPAEEFFAVGRSTLEISFAMPSDDDVAEWWIAQRRHAHTSWVAGIMAVCVAVLVLGVLR